MQLMQSIHNNQSFTLKNASNTLNTQHQHIHAPLQTAKEDHSQQKQQQSVAVSMNQMNRHTMLTGDKDIADQVSARAQIDHQVHLTLTSLLNATVESIEQPNAIDHSQSVDSHESKLEPVAAPVIHAARAEQISTPTVQATAVKSHATIKSNTYRSTAKVRIA